MEKFRVIYVNFPFYMHHCYIIKANFCSRMVIYFTILNEFIYNDYNSDTVSQNHFELKKIIFKRVRIYTCANRNGYGLCSECYPSFLKF